MKINFKSTRSIQVMIFFALYILLEIILRLFGMRAGTLIDDFKVEEDPVYEARFLSDSLGINHILPEAKNLMAGTVINKQGFRSSFNFTSHIVDSIRQNTKEEILMIVGDSFVEGCCADSVTNSFPDLIDRDKKYVVLNFGVSGTDPLQYELLVKRYVKELRPDRLIVTIYFGNDVVNFNRIATPNIPLTYPFKNNKWLYSVAPNNLSGRESYVFKNYREAYDFYVEHYTLKGQNRNLFEKSIQYSVLFSKVYLYAEHKLAKWKWEREHSDLRYDGMAILYKNLISIVSACDTAQVPYLFVAIPAPLEAHEGKGLKTKYAAAFKDIKWFVPEDLTLKDYDGSSIANHLNRQGHKKYAEFLKKVVEEESLGEPAKIKF
jgi:hypothetical protein